MLAQPQNQSENVPLNPLMNGGIIILPKKIGEKKDIQNKDVIEEIRAEIRRLSEL